MNAKLRLCCPIGQSGPTISHTNQGTRPCTTPGCCAAMQHVKPSASESLAQAPKSYTKVTQKLRENCAKVAKQAATMIQHLAQCKMSCQPATQMYNLGM